MVFDFDPEKDARNIVKHGVSLAAASDMEWVIAEPDPRFTEARFRAYGLIEGVRYGLAYTIRDRRLRAISLRRARAKEFEKHAL